MAEFLSDNPEIYGVGNTDNLQKAQSAQAALEEIQTENFYNTLKSYYSYRNADDKFQSMSPADLLEYFYEDRSWRNNNTVSMGMDLANVYGEKDEKRLKEFAYIQQTYEALPSFWNDPNRSFGGWLIDNGGAMLSDPANLIGVGVGGQVAKQSYKMGLKELLKGKMANEINKAAIEEMARQSTKASLGQAVAKGALYEGYFGAITNGVQDTILQNTAIQSGVQDELDLKQTALSTAAGFGFGTVFGGVFSAGSFSLTTRNLKNQTVKQLLDVQEYGRSTITGRQLYEALAIPKTESQLFKNLPAKAADETDPAVTTDTFKNRFLNLKVTPITSADKPPTLPINITRYKKGAYTLLLKQRAEAVREKVASADPTTQEQIIDDAIILGDNPEQLRREVKKMVKDPKLQKQAVYIVANGDLLARDASEIVALTNEYSRIDLTPKRRKELEAQIDDMIEALDETLTNQSNLSTYAARGTFAGNIVKDMKRAAELIVNPEDPKMKQLKEGDKAKFYEALSKLDDNEQVILALQNARKANKWDLAAEYINNNLLSSPDTHILNMISGLVQTQWKPFVMLLRAANMARADKQRAIEIAREAFQTYVYQYVYMGHALKAAGKTFIKGRATLDSGQMKFDSNIRQGQLQRWISETAKLLTEPLADVSARISNDAIGSAVGKVAQAPFEAAGLVTTIPMRILSAGDEFLKTMTFKARLASIVNTEIMRQNPDYGIFLKGKAFSQDYKAKFKEIEKRYVNEKGVANAIGTTVGEQLNSPLQYSREISYTQSAYSTNPVTNIEEGGITGDILKATQQPNWKWTRAFGLHFINTPSNLLRWNFQHLPLLGRYQFQMRHMLAEEGGEAANTKVKQLTRGVRNLFGNVKYVNPEAAAEANARIQAGYLIMSTAIAAVMAGKFTGGGSKDWRENQQKQELTGWQPYSYVTDDGRYISLNRLDPLFTPFFIIADIKETLDKVLNFNEDLPPKLESMATELAVGLALSLTRNLTSKFYTKNIVDTIASFQNGGDLMARKPEQKIEATLSRAAMKLLPLSGGVRYVDRVSDEWEKDLWSLSDRMSTYFTDNPMEKPMPKRNMLGQKIQRKNGWLFGLGGETGLWSSPFAMTEWKKNETANFFVDRKITYRPPSSMDKYAPDLDLRAIRNANGQTAYDRWLEIKSELKLTDRGLVSKNGTYNLQEYIEKIISDKKSSLYLEPSGLVNGKDKQQQFILQRVYAVENVAYWEMVKEFPQITEEVNKSNFASREAYRQAKETRNVYIQQENSLQKLMEYGK